MSSDIFISYAREDRARVQPIAEALAARGYGVWWDKGLRSGEDYRDRIEEMLKTAKCVIVAWSKDSVQSDFVLDEAGRGHRRRVLLPVFIDEGVEPPLGFGAIHTSDLSGWVRDPSDPAPFEQFVGDVAAVLGREPAPAPPPPPRSAATGTGRKVGLLPVAIGGGVVVLAFGAYLATRPPGGERPAPPAADSGQVTASPAGVADSPSVAPAPRARSRAAALGDVVCTLPGTRRNPIQERAERLAGTPFSVDTGTHLLLQRSGAPVSIVPARVASDSLRSRRLIVAHYTAMPAGTSAAYLNQARATASTHLLIAQDGSVTQLVPFDMIAGHAAGSRWRDLQSLNAHSIGIHLDNLGLLKRRGDEWVSEMGTPAPADAVDMVEGRAWHRYTDAQLRAFVEVSCALRRAYPGIEDVVGHDSVSIRRKTDPGPAFPVSLIRSRLFPER